MIENEELKRLLNLFLKGDNLVTRVEQVRDKSNRDNYRVTFNSFDAGGEMAAAYAVYNNRNKVPAIRDDETAFGMGVISPPAVVYFGKNSMKRFLDGEVYILPGARMPNQQRGGAGVQHQPWQPLTARFQSQHQPQPQHQHLQHQGQIPQPQHQHLQHQGQIPQPQRQFRHPEQQPFPQNQALRQHHQLPDVPPSYDKVAAQDKVGREIFKILMPIYQDSTTLNCDQGVLDMACREIADPQKGEYNIPWTTVNNYAAIAIAQGLGLPAERRVDINTGKLTMNPEQRDNFLRAVTSIENQMGGSTLSNSKDALIPPARQGAMALEGGHQNDRSPNPNNARNPRNGGFGRGFAQGQGFQ